MYEFTCRTGKIIIDHSKCAECTTKACIKGCSLYGRSILRIQEGKPVLAIAPSETNRLCIEDLGCEYECWFRGKQAIKIELLIPGLEQYKKKIKLV